MALITELTDSRLIGHRVFVGAVVHFTLLSAIVWFCCSVFNVLVAIMTFSTNSIIKRHPKAFFLLEFILASVIPGSIVAAVYKTSSYKPDVLLMYLCIPASYDNIFYSYTLPFQIYCICVMAMCIIIIRRIKQVSMVISYIPILYMYFPIPLVYLLTNDMYRVPSRNYACNQASSIHSSPLGELTSLLSF